MLLLFTIMLLPPLELWRVPLSRDGIFLIRRYRLFLLEEVAVLKRR